MTFLNKDFLKKTNSFQALLLLLKTPIYTLYMDVKMRKFFIGHTFPYTKVFE